MTALICGSMAYDTIMVFPDQFKNHILPDKVHILNVSFLVPHLRREYGGCAGNIAYNLHLLQEDPLILATVGHDFEPYAQWLSQQGLSAQCIKILDDHYTAQAYITTDINDNQITAFHPGAMSYSHENPVPADLGVSIGIIAPDGKQGMQEHAAQFAALNIPFIFDPGQGLPMLNGEELLHFIELADYAAFNDYESALVQERTGQSLEQLAARVKALIVTLGGQGSHIYTGGRRIDIPAAPIRHPADPTGCGDAYRAGLLYGLLNQHDWETTGRIASLLGAIKIEHPGTQNHHFSMHEFKQRYHAAFGAIL